MKKKRIVFRADGSVIAGYGHVIRSLSLASILKRSYTLIFIIQNPDSFLREQIVKVCDEIIELPESNKFKAEATALIRKSILQDDIVVLDGYNFDTDYQKVIKKACFKLICIDDIHTIHFSADVILNHGEGVQKENYSADYGTQFCLGAQYAILRKSFLKPAPKADLKFNKHRAFISMGGTDKQNFTEKALRLCLAHPEIRSVDVVVGSYYQYKEQLKKLALTHKNIDVQIYSNLSETAICKLMKQSTVALCSASTISYEYASVGGVLLAYQTVENQKNIYSFLIRSKVAFPVSSFDVVLENLKSKKWRDVYFENRKNYFSGDSAQRLTQIFKTLETERGLARRSAESKDVLTYFRWANDNDVRQNAVHSEPILLEDHKAWFNARLKSKDAFLLLFEKYGKPLGQVRLEKRGNEAEIDFSVGRPYRGKGYGQIILRQAIQQYVQKFPDTIIVAKVKQSNEASNKVFIKLGFKVQKPSSLKGLLYNNYTLKIKANQ